MTTDGKLEYGQYRVQQREDGTPWTLGRGSMGVTYRAVHTGLDSPVALKVIDSDRMIGEVDEKRFVREARFMAGLRHRNIASVYHLAQEDGQYFYAMELINGETAQEFVGRCGPMQIDAALRVASQICNALVAAARNNLVHRDVKPANIMIVFDADEDCWPFVKLIDFGVVRSLACEEASYATLPGFVGTAQFASPEQIQEQEVDAKADIYSLGYTLWYLLTGAPPFTGSLASVFNQHLNSDPPWHVLKPFPKSVVRLMAGMLQKEPDRRPGALEAKRELENCLEELLRPECAKKSAGLSWFIERPRTVLIGAAALLLLLLAFGPAVGRVRAPQSEVIPVAQKPPPPKPADFQIPERTPEWTYLPAVYPPSHFLISSRPVSLSRTVVPVLGAPDSSSWLDESAGEKPNGLTVNPFDEPVFLSDVSMLNDLPDLDNEPSKGGKPASPVTGRSEQGFSPSREIDRARRNIERALRRIF